MEVEAKIREKAKELLESKAVDVVIGFEKGTLPLRSTPAFIRDSSETDRLVWNSFCENNLATYLNKLKGQKVAIVAKGCDSRSVVALAVERQIKREDVFVIGVPCRGMLDRRRIEEAVGFEILSALESDGKLVVKSVDSERTLDREDFLFPSCRSCRHRNPVIYDFLAGEKVEESEVDEFELVREFESKPPEERWEYFKKAFEDCLRCYACREACPFCYCEECFVDSSRPKWIEKGLDETDVQIWHIVRAYHHAGRCVDCGACERACPMGIDLRFLTQKLNKDVKELFGFETGLDPSVQPPLSTFSLQDPDDFK